MKINRIEITSPWPFKIPVMVLCVYFFVILPCTQLFFRTHPWLYKFSDDAFFALVVMVLMAIFKNNLSALGLSSRYLKQHLVVGAVAGSCILLCLPLLELGLNITGLAEHELLAGEVKENLYDTGVLTEKSVRIFLIPLIEQIFFTGFILQSLLKKYNPIIAIYTVGLVYTLAGLKLSLGAFVMGIGTSLLFKLTGTVFAPFIFHMSCVLGGVLVEYVYPRLITLLLFLW